MVVVAVMGKRRASSREAGGLPVVAEHKAVTEKRSGRKERRGIMSLRVRRGAGVGKGKGKEEEIGESTFNDQVCILA